MSNKKTPELKPHLKKSASLFDDTVPCPKCSNLFDLSSDQFIHPEEKLKCGSCGSAFSLKSLYKFKYSPAEKTKPEARPTIKKEPAPVQTIIQARPVREAQLDRPLNEKRGISSTSTNNILKAHTQNEVAKPAVPSLPVQPRRENLRKEPLFTEPLTQRRSNKAALSMSRNKAPASLDKLRKPVRRSTFEEPSSSRKLFKFLFSLLLMALAVLLALLFCYQLWFHNKIDWPFLDKFSPRIEQVSSRFNKPIPNRNDIVNLNLTSTRLAPHPSIAGITLLKFSLLNSSKNKQPLPWVELTLKDTEGRTISRRSFAPGLYLAKNKNRMIKKNELKRITLELNSFPEQAQGYQLRLLDK